MVRELKGLGFEYLEEYKTHVFILKDRCLEININSNRVYIMNQKKYYGFNALQLRKG